MITKGLVSVTFRSMSREGVVSAAKKASLSEIEWGGDIHVPLGDLTAAADARELCRRHGISQRSYGSYYRFDSDFSPVADTALALGADSIRVWAGSSGSCDTDVMTYSALIARLCQNAEDAAGRGLSLSFEYHPGTLTDSAASAVRLVRDAAHDNVRLHWQPNQYRDTKYNASELRRVAPYVDTVHVFAWEGERRLPLSSHADAWREYFEILGSFGAPRAALIEFLPSGTEDELLRDAEVLARLTENL